MKIFLKTGFVLVAALFLSSGGCGSACVTDDRFEGFKEDRLRVYVRASFDNVQEEDEKKINEYILASGKKRARGLLESYINVNVSEEGEREKWMKKIPGSLAHHDTHCRECFDEYCEAFIEFNTPGFQDLKKE